MPHAEWRVGRNGQWRPGVAIGQPLGDECRLPLAQLRKWWIAAALEATLCDPSRFAVAHEND